MAKFGIDTSRSLKCTHTFALLKSILSPLLFEVIFYIVQESDTAALVEVDALSISPSEAYISGTMPITPLFASESTLEFILSSSDISGVNLWLVLATINIVSKSDLDYLRSL